MPDRARIDGFTRVTTVRVFPKRPRGQSFREHCLRDHWYVCRIKTLGVHQRWHHARLFRGIGDRFLFWPIPDSFGHGFFGILCFWDPVALQQTGRTRGLCHRGILVARYGHRDRADFSFSWLRAQPVGVPFW